MVIYASMIPHRSVDRILSLQNLMPVPVTNAFASGLVGSVEQLNESHTLFDKTTSENAIPRKIAFEPVFGIIGPIEFEYMLWLVVNVADLGNAKLHASG